MMIMMIMMMKQVTKVRVQLCLSQYHQEKRLKVLNTKPYSLDSNSMIQHQMHLALTHLIQAQVEEQKVLAIQPTTIALEKFETMDRFHFPCDFQGRVGRPMSH